MAEPVVRGLSTVPPFDVDGDRATAGQRIVEWTEQVDIFVQASGITTLTDKLPSSRASVGLV